MYASRHHSLFREASLLGRIIRELGHSGFVELRDTHFPELGIADEDMLWIRFEYVEWETLEQFLAGGP